MLSIKQRIYLMYYVLYFTLFGKSATQTLCVLCKMFQSQCLLHKIVSLHEHYGKLKL